jgi:CRISPR-associated endonuclease/helicase Cas3
MSDDTDFESTFLALTGNEPFPWQHELFTRLTQGRIPSACRIPTGLGKTAIIPIWLIALSRSSGRRAGFDQVPRRLVYVVNRRTIVDQATDETTIVRKRLHSESSLSDLLSRLMGLVHVRPST